MIDAVHDHVAEQFQPYMGNKRPRPQGLNQWRLKYFNKNLLIHIFIYCKQGGAGFCFSNCISCNSETFKSLIGDFHEPSWFRRADLLGGDWLWDLIEC